MTSEEFDLTRFLPYLLNQAAEASSLGFQRQYKDRYGMLRTEWRVLFHLGLYGEMNAREIAVRARMHKTKISRAVQRLVDQRLVTRRRDEQDRRLDHLTLTGAGQKAYADLAGIAQNYDAKLAAQLTPNEAKVLRRALEKLGTMQNPALLDR